MTAKKNVKVLLRNFLPSASKQEVQSVGDRVLERLQSDPDRMPVRVVPFDDARRESRRWVPALTLASAIAIVVLIPLAMLRRAPAILEDGAESIRIHFGDVVRANDSGSTLVLADTSRVEMRANSELVLERADDGMRIRLNKGSVIVNAAKQHGHLYVQTRDLKVSVVGTVFLVNADDKGSRVAVIEGEVRVKQGAVEKSLRRGEQVSTNSSMEPQLVIEEISWSPKAGAHMVELLRPGQGGLVTGSVRTTDGKPAAGLRVAAIRTDSADRALGAIASLAQTDGLGGYRLENVSPGTYFITVGRIGLPTYYPGTLEIAKAEAVSISSTSTTSVIDIVLQEVSGALPPAARAVWGTVGSTSPGDCERWPLCTAAEARKLILADPRALYNILQQRGWSRLALATPVPNSPDSPHGGFFFPYAWSDEEMENRLGLTETQKLKLDAIADEYNQIFLPNNREFQEEEAILKGMVVVPETREITKTVSVQAERVLGLRRIWAAGNLKVTKAILEVLTDRQKVRLQTEKFPNDPRLAGLLLSDLRKTSEKLLGSAEGR